MTFSHGENPNFSMGFWMDENERERMPFESVLCATNAAEAVSVSLPFQAENPLRKGTVSTAWKVHTKGMLFWGEKVPKKVYDCLEAMEKHSYCAPFLGLFTPRKVYLSNGLFMSSKLYLFGVYSLPEKTMKWIPLQRHLWHIKPTRKASFPFHFHPSKTPLKSLGFPREKKSSKLGQIISFSHPQKWHKTDSKL